MTKVRKVFNGWLLAYLCRHCFEFNQIQLDKAGGIRAVMLYSHPWWVGKLMEGFDDTHEAVAGGLSVDQDSGEGQGRARSTGRGHRRADRLDYD